MLSSPNASPGRSILLVLYVFYKFNRKAGSIRKGYELLSLYYKGSCIKRETFSSLSKFRPNYYDLALLDHLMPHLNDLELYTRIREIGSRMRGLILTATQE